VNYHQEIAYGFANTMAVPDGTTNGTSNGTSNGHNTTTSSQPLPVVISGGGCVGLFLALSLALSSIPNKILVIEPQTPDPTATRAMAHQPHTYPILSRIPGLLPELINTGNLSTGLCFRTSPAHGSKVIAEKKFHNDGPGMKGKGQLLLPQGLFQQVLLGRLKALGEERVQVRIGSSVTGFVQNANSVTVHVTSSSTGNEQKEEDTEASYLLAADGAHSIIRKALAVPFEGETLSTHLIALDLHSPLFATHSFHNANFIVDPTHYGQIGRIHPETSTSPELWRVSFGLQLADDATEQQVEELVHDKLRYMLPDGGVDEQGKRAYEIARIAPYKAQQRLAKTLYKERICLLGDAAHLTNPYAGLGLASGLADAASLAEVLERVLSGQARDTVMLLGKWSEARRKTFMEAVDRPSRMAYARVRSDVSSEEKVRDLLDKDTMVGALERGVPVMPMGLETRGEELDGQ
jgi:2-polyprenyl-6-methoxyphenol hydroxylase-like FAD-dependent oxidoreductase